MFSNDKTRVSLLLEIAKATRLQLAIQGGILLVSVMQAATPALARTVAPVVAQTAAQVPAQAAAYLADHKINLAYPKKLCHLMSLSKTKQAREIVDLNFNQKGIRKPKVTILK